MAPLYKPLYTAFLHSIKLFEYRIAIKFDKDTFAAEQNNYLSKIVNVYIVCDWPALPRNPTNNLRFKNYLFGLTSIVKILIKKKVCGTTFDSASSWSFGNDFARNVIIFGVDNHSSSHLGNLKNNVLVLGEGPTYGINGSFDSPEKRKAKFCLSLHYNANNSYLFVNGKKNFIFKADNKNVNFSTQFCLGSISNRFSATEYRQVSLFKWKCVWFSSRLQFYWYIWHTVLNNHKYLMTKSTIK